MASSPKPLLELQQPCGVKKGQYTLAWLAEILKLGVLSISLQASSLDMKLLTGHSNLKAPLFYPFHQKKKVYRSQEVHW
jgi:hypothetical protein